MSETRLIHYFQKHIDSLTVTQSLVHWAFPPPLFIPSKRDHAILVALRHNDERLAEADRAGIQAYLQTFDEHHIVQLVSKIKKILHDICLIRLNNEDGDSLYASYFEHKSHDAFDVLLADTQTGESSKIRLSTEKTKAFKPNEWHKNFENLFESTEELSTQSRIQEGTLNSKYLSQSIEDAMDLLVTAKDPNDEHFWDYFPATSLASVSIAIFDFFSAIKKSKSHGLNLNG